MRETGLAKPAREEPARASHSLGPLNKLSGIRAFVRGPPIREIFACDGGEFPRAVDGGAKPNEPFGMHASRYAFIPTWSPTPSSS